MENAKIFRQEDPLVYLPTTNVVSLPSGAVIYDFGQVPDSLYLVQQGHVVISYADGKASVVLRSCGPEDFFGEHVLTQQIGERAEALGDLRVMCWSAAMLEEMLLAKPRLGIGLAQELSRRSIALSGRILSISTESIPHRLARVLLHLAGAEHSSAVSGQQDVLYLPHKVLAQYVGTSREVVTHALNFFRRQQMIVYSRRHMNIDVDAFRAFLADPSPSLEGSDIHDSALSASAAA